MNKSDYNFMQGVFADFEKLANWYKKFLNFYQESLTYGNFEHILKHRDTISFKSWKDLEKSENAPRLAEMKRLARRIWKKHEQIQKYFETSEDFQNSKNWMLKQDFFYWYFNLVVVYIAKVSKELDTYNFRFFSEFEKLKNTFEKIAA